MRTGKYYPRKGRKSAPRRKYAKRVYKKKSSLVKTIKQVVHRMAENKTWVNYAANQGIQTNLGSSSPFQVGLLPNPTQGTTVQQRIGNQIRVVKNIFKYAINLTPYNATSNPSTPVYVKLWVISLKYKSNYGGALTTSDFNDFFQIGATNVDFQGNSLDTLFGVNTDLFTLHTTRTHILGTLGTAFGGSLTGANAPCARGTIYLDKCAKLLKYNDTSTDCANRSLWLIAQCVNVDGSTGTGITAAEMHYTHEVHFEDF